MKNFKRFLSLLLTLTMVLTLSSTVFASGQGELAGGELTVKNVEASQNYNVYQLFYLVETPHTTTSEDGKTQTTTYTYSLKANDSWKDFLSSNDINNKYIKYNSSTEEVTLIDTVDITANSEFAKEVNKWLNDENHTITATATATSGSDSVVKFNDLQLGYYYTDCLTDGAVYSLNKLYPQILRSVKHEMEAPADQTQTGTITVKDAVENEEYSIYQILYIDSFVTGNSPASGGTTDEEGNVKGGNYSYKPNSSWVDFILYGAGKDFFEIDKNNYVVWKSTAGKTRPEVAVLAEKALDYAISHNIAPVQTTIASEETSVDSDGNTTTSVVVKFSDVKLGYYLLDTSLGSLCSLNTTRPDLILQEKNNVPKNDKQVKEGDNEWGKKNDTTIGSTVEFNSTITVENGTSKLVFHDKMCDALDLVSNSIKVYTDFGKTSEVYSSNYQIIITDYEDTSKTNNDAIDTEIVVTKDESDNEITTDNRCTFHIVFNENFIKTYTSGGKLYVFYSATLNENAVIGGPDGNLNESKISYGDKNHTTPKSETRTYTWEIPVFKYTMTGENNSIATPLKDAKFALLPAESSTETAIEVPSNAIHFVYVKQETTTIKSQDNEGNEVTTTYTWDIYRLAKETAWDDNGKAIAWEDEATTTITTGETGRFKLVGLDSGNYQLKEIEAPKGYHLLRQAINIRIDDTGKVYRNNTPADTIGVENGAGSLMPETGGIGTTIFYIVGSVLLVGAGVLLVTKKRMSETK